MLQLPIWLSASILFVSAGAGVLYGQRLLERGVRLGDRFRLRELPFIPACLIAFVILLAGTNYVVSHPRLGWYVPVIVDYHVPVIFWALRLALVTFALVAISFLAWRVRHRRRLAIFAFTVFVLSAVEVTSRYVHRPQLPPLENKVEQGVVLQSSTSTCAPAASATIARQFGLRPTEAEMVDRMNTTWAGTSPAQIIYGMRSLGLDAKKRDIPSRNLAELTPPAILLVDYKDKPDAHAMAFLGGREKHWIVADPQVGRMTITGEGLKEIWRGHAIEIRLDGN